MQISLQNFSTLVDSMAATVQGSCSGLIDLTIGSVLRAILEAAASVALWLQYLLLQLLTMTRLGTSVGSDADSWVEDFGLARLPAIAATGQVLFTSFNPTSQASTIADGVTVKTSDGSQSFTVTGGPYTRAAGAVNVLAEVVCTAAGAIGNVQSGIVSILGTAVPGIDTVSNPNAFTGGQDAETDASLRLRFVSYINTRSQATEQAIANAIVSVQQGLTYSIEENVIADGSSLPGHVHIIVDDGSGMPSVALLKTVAAAVDLVRPIGTTISIAAPVVLLAGITALVTVDGSVPSEVVQSNINLAIVSYVDGLGVGQPLRFSRLAGICYDADASVTNVQAVVLNGAALDVGGEPGSVVRSGTMSFEVTSV